MSRDRWRRCSRPSLGWSANGRRARRRCSWPAPSTKSSRTSAHRAWPRQTMGPSWRSSPSRRLLNLVHCHKGALRWKIRTRGVACHSSTPHLGVKRHLQDGPGPRRSREICQRAGRVDARPDSRPADACRSVGSRGGRASTWSPTGARSKSIAASSPAKTPQSAMKTVRAACGSDSSTSPIASN